MSSPHIGEPCPNEGCGGTLLRHCLVNGCDWVRCDGCRWLGVPGTKRWKPPTGNTPKEKP